MKTGKIIHFILLLITIIISSCSKSKNNTFQDNTILPNQEIIKEDIKEEKITQNENPLLSTYSEGPSDGYSWRKREINYDKNTSSISKEILVSTIWVKGIADGYNSKLVFYLDDVFRMGTNQTGVESEGSYQIIDDNTVELTFIKKQI